MSTTENDVVKGIRSEYQYGFSNPDEAKDYFFKSGRGLSHEVVEAIAEHKNEPQWMRDFRHKALDYFYARPMPTWGGNVGEIDFENIYYYIKPTENQVDKWEDLPAEILDTWDKLGIPEAEKKYLAGVGAQYESEVVYHKLQEDLETQGRDLPRHGLGAARARGHRQAVHGDDHPARTTTSSPRSTRRSGRAARSSTCRPASRIEMPLQAYFRINAENMGQFERTLIIVDEDAYVHYVEGCTAPIYSSDSLHSAVVEIIVKPRRPLPLHDDPELVEQRLQPRHQARRRLRGRDDGVGRRQPRLQADDEVPGHLADGRARARRGAVDRVRRQGPAPGRRRQGRPRRARTRRRVITSKSISKDGGRAGYRGLLEVATGATGSKSKVVCDALILDDESRSDTYPYIKVDESDVDLGHEATRLEDRRGAALLPDEPRPLRGRGERDDRLRVRRADHEGAAARVRGRDEPADPAADGRQCWLSRHDRRARRFRLGARHGSRALHARSTATRSASSRSGRARGRSSSSART